MKSEGTGGFLSKAVRKTKDIFYDFSVYLHGKVKRKQTGTMTAAKRKKLAFYIVVLALPVAQFLLFYVYVNINSVLLAFKEYDYSENTYNWVYFDNIIQVFKDFVGSPMIKGALKNTAILFAVTMLIGIPLPIVVSYYLYKKGFFYKGFRIVLYLPSIISSLAIVLAYKYFLEIAIPEIWLKLFGKEIKGLITNLNTRYGSLLFYYLWFGIGSSFMLYASAMSGISQSVTESAQLDGATPFKEFLYIIVPLIYPTFVTYVISNIAVIFSNQMNLYSFFGIEAIPKLQTIGYYLYKEISISGIRQYPYLAAFGIVCTMICIPICLSSKLLLEKLGPSAE